VYFDTPDYDPFWEIVQELHVPVYFHPRYAISQDLQPGTKYGDRKHLLGAGVQFHFDLSRHLYAICSSVYSIDFRRYRSSLVIWVKGQYTCKSIFTLTYTGQYPFQPMES
jgi:hypothetical protein